MAKTSDPIPLEENNVISELEEKDPLPNANNFDAIKYHQEKDKIDKKYILDTNHFIQAWSTEFANAYAIQGIDPNIMYGLVYDNTSPKRYKVIGKLKSNSLPHSVRIHAAEIVFFTHTNQRNLAVIIDRPQGQPLLHFAHKFSPSLEKELVRDVIKPINEALKELHVLNITHGNLSPETIYWNESKKLTLGECISAPCGYLQKANYEPIDRALALPLGKGKADYHCDYYALGIILYTLLYCSPEKPLNEAIFFNDRFIHGTFHSLLREKPLSSTLQDLFIGLLHDKSSERWDYAKLEQWIGGKSFNAIPSITLPEPNRPINFNGKEYVNRIHLAHGLHKDWEIAKSFVIGDKIQQWIERSVRDEKCAELLAVSRKSFLRDNPESSGFVSKEEELLIRTILILHPTGPIRIKRYSVHFDALNVFLNAGIKYKEYINVVRYVLQKNLMRYAFITNENSFGVQRLEQVAPLLNRTSLGFGMERCLYELNPYLPCLNPQLLPYYVLSLEEIMNELEKLSFTQESSFIDHHITSFIASRIQLSTEIQLKSLSRFPHLARHTNVQIAAILALAQKQTSTKQYPNLVRQLVKLMSIFTNLITGKTLKAEVFKKLEMVEGNIAKMLSIVADPRYLVQDELNFSTARKQYKYHSDTILTLQNKKNLKIEGYQKGMRFALVIASAVCLIVFFIVVFK